MEALSVAPAGEVTDWECPVGVSVDEDEALGGPSFSA
jgi:hypothetical protein